MYPRTSYIIYATERSGSTLLCEALGNTNLAGKPTEYYTPILIPAWLDHFRLTTFDSATYLQNVYTTGTTPNGVFSIKILWHYFRDCLDQLRNIEGNEHLSIPELLSTTFPDHRTIMITRRDKVRQAISFWKACQTNQWWLISEDDTAAELQKSVIAQEPTFNFQNIEALRQLIVNHEKKMQQFFSSHHIQTFTVVYEDFVHNYEETVLQILDYLHIPVPKKVVFTERKLKKQSNEQTEEWVRQYYQIKQEQEKINLKNFA